MNELPPMGKCLRFLNLRRCEAKPIQVSSPADIAIEKWTVDQLHNLRSIDFRDCKFPLRFTPSDEGPRLSHIQIENHRFYAHDKSGIKLRSLKGDSFERLPKSLTSVILKNVKLKMKVLRQFPPSLTYLSLENCPVSLEGCSFSVSLRQIRKMFPSAIIKGVERFSKPNWQVDLEKLVMGQERAVSKVSSIITKLKIKQASQIKIDSKRPKSEKLKSVVRKNAKKAHQNAKSIGRGVGGAAGSAASAAGLPGGRGLGSALGKIVSFGAKRTGKAIAKRTRIHGELIKREESEPSPPRPPAKPDRPQAVLYFAGPAGTGKTTLAKQMATTLGRPYVVIDMGGLSGEGAVNRIIGAPPGYTGHKKTRTLVDEVNDHPNVVMILNEMELGNDKLLDTFLGIFDGAYLRDSNSNSADFRNTIIIMTSNLGATEIASLNWDSPCTFDGATERVVELLETKGDSTHASEATQAFASRVKRGVIPFRPISLVVAKNILADKARRIEQKIYQTRGIHLTISDSALKWIFAAQPITPTGGVRPMVEELEDLLDDVLTTNDSLMGKGGSWQVKAMENADEDVLLTERREYDSGKGLHVNGFEITAMRGPVPEQRTSTSKQKPRPRKKGKERIK